MRFTRLTAIAAGAALTLAACGGDDPDSGGDENNGGDASEDDGGDEQPEAGGEFRAAINADPGNLDPHLTVLSATRWVNAFMYDSLVSIDAEGTIHPYLAESWDVSLDSVTYTLKEGITCADGSPLTASDVAANFGFVADPANESPQLGLFVQPGVEATADDEAGTVTLTSAAPDPFMLQGTGLMHIACSAGMEDRSLLEEGSGGTGMYTLTEAVPSDHYTFEVREDYAWGPGDRTAADAGVPGTVRLNVVPNESTAANMFLAGDIELANIVGPDAERVAGEATSTLEPDELYAELTFNQAEGLPGADPAVREALVSAVDIPELGAVFTDGQGAPADGIGILEPNPCPSDVVSGNLPAHDPEAAATTLEEAGWELGDDGVRAKDGEPLSIKLAYTAELGEGITPGAELLAEKWGELGVETELSSLTTTQLNEALFATGDWDAMVVLVSVSFPSQFLPFFSGPAPADGGTNFASLANADYEAAAAEAAALNIDEGGCDKWDEAHSALVSNLDVVPVVDAVRPWFLNGVEAELQVGNPLPATIRLSE